jgi:superfamily II DNA or RNA helicase
MKPYRWQEEAVERNTARDHFCLWVDCGCGKTLALILIALRKMLPTIVIAPGHTLCEQWKRELIESGAAEEKDIWVYDRNEERQNEEAYKAAYRAWIEEGVSETGI